MIKAEFVGGSFKRGFCVQGHAGYASAGEDIVCAAVTSAVQLTINAITEVLKINPEVAVNENEISLSLTHGSPKEAYQFVEALYLHLKLLEEDYGKNIKVIVTEV